VKVCILWVFFSSYKTVDKKSYKISCWRANIVLFLRKHVGLRIRTVFCYERNFGKVKYTELDYIHSPAHDCITEPPCVAPSGDSARVIA